MTMWYGPRPEPEEVRVSDDAVSALDPEEPESTPDREDDSPLTERGHDDGGGGRGQSSGGAID
jgi:hypothetical protein